MSTAEEPSIGPTEKCGQCNKEISRAQAMTREGEEYALFFCDLECYEKWLERDTKKPRDQA